MKQYIIVQSDFKNYLLIDTKNKVFTRKWYYNIKNLQNAKLDGIMSVPLEDFIRNTTMTSKILFEFDSFENFIDKYPEWFI